MKGHISKRGSEPVDVLALGVGFCFVAVGDVLGQVLGDVADAPVGVFRPAENALCVEAVAEPGDVQRLVILADGVERVVPRRQQLGLLVRHRS